MSERDMKTECWPCHFKLNNPFSCHIGCRMPDLKMTGNQHGIDRGWFFYPILFDPVWKTKLCDNFLKKES